MFSTDPNLYDNETAPSQMRIPQSRQSTEDIIEFRYSAPGHKAPNKNGLDVVNRDTRKTDSQWRQDNKTRLKSTRSNSWSNGRKPKSKKILGDTPCGSCQAFSHDSCRPTLSGTLCTCNCDRAVEYRDHYSRAADKAAKVGLPAPTIEEAVGMLHDGKQGGGGKVWKAAHRKLQKEGKLPTVMMSK